MFEREHDINVLNGLIETTLDSVDGYHRAAQECPNPSFRSAFMDRANERQQIVHRLRERVSQLGAQPEDEGSILAKAHRFFLSLRDRVDADAVLAEIDRGESYLAGKWQAALSDNDLLPDTRRLITDCHESVRSGHEQWRQAHLDASQTGTSAGGAFELAGGAEGE